MTEARKRVEEARAALVEAVTRHVIARGSSKTYSIYHLALGAYRDAVRAAERVSLPVIRTCGDCRHMGSRSEKGYVCRVCEHPESTTPLTKLGIASSIIVSADKPPPTSCPLRSETPR